MDHMELERSKALFARAQKSIPGGVNSPVRAFKAVGGDPLFIKKAKGAYLYDEDDNRYLDLINSWGPMILGHAKDEFIEVITKQLANSFSFGAPTHLEIQMAELMCEMVPNLDKVRMVNSGTEATMSAIRLARGYTGRDKIIKFEGCYHGHGDSFLIAAGSGAITFGEPNSPGVTQGTALDTLTAPYNDLDAVKALVEANSDQVACIIIEPVAGNMGCVLPNEGFLRGLRTLCDEQGILLIFDEVMTGFRLAPAGAQEVYNVWADLVTYGKIIGGGMPVGAYGGKEEIMNFVSPVGPVYQAGTLSGNPIAMTSGIAILTYLNESRAVYKSLEEKVNKITNGWQENLDEMGLPYTMNKLGSMFSMFFTEQKVEDFEGAKAANQERFGSYFREMLKRNIYLPPSQYESAFLSDAVDDSDIDDLITAHKASLQAIH